MTKQDKRANNELQNTTPKTKEYTARPLLQKTKTKTKTQVLPRKGKQYLLHL